jgi:hypothetical protein
MKTVWTLLTVVMLAGCSTAVPVTVRFPDAPGRLATTPCPPLKKLEDTAGISDVSRTVTNNYTLYYECVTKTDAWIEWYQIQRQIFEQVQK